VPSHPRRHLPAAPYQSMAAAPPLPGAVCNAAPRSGSLRRHLSFAACTQIMRACVTTSLPYFLFCLPICPQVCPNVMNLKCAVDKGCYTRLAKVGGAAAAAAVKRTGRSAQQAWLGSRSGPLRCIGGGVVGHTRLPLGRH
jgi:hypothetical protein